MSINGRSSFWPPVVLFLKHSLLLKEIPLDLLPAGEVVLEADAEDVVVVFEVWTQLWLS